MKNLSIIRKRLNNHTKNIGNRVCESLGDLLTAKINKNLVLGLSLATLISGCSKGIPNSDYTVVENVGSKIRSLGFGYRYDFFEGDENGHLIYTIEPNWNGKSDNFYLSDNYLLKDGNGKMISVVDGKILTLSATHKAIILDSGDNIELSRQFMGSFFDRVGRLLLNKDGYYVKDNNGRSLLEVRETWDSVMSPFLREYIIIDPNTGNQIGMIKNKFNVDALIGAQTYNISLENNTPSNVRNLALLIRIIDGLEDQEDSESSSNSDND